jgi:hypothetical protein
MSDLFSPTFLAQIKVVTDAFVKLRLAMIYTRAGHPNNKLLARHRQRRHK